MPTYTYRCQTCGHQFDIFQKFSENSLTECPECHGALKKVLHPVGVVFKGSGWYITDSRKGQSSESGSSDKSDSTAKPAADKTKESKTTDTTKSTTESSSKETKSESSPKAASTSTD